MCTHMPGVNCFFLPYNGHLRLSSQSPAGHTHPGWICLRKLQVQIWPPLCGILLQPLSGLQTRRQGSLIPKVLLPARPSVLLDRTGRRLKLGDVLKAISSRSKDKGLSAANATNSETRFWGLCAHWNKCLSSRVLTGRR